MVENLCSARIKYIQSDAGGEFIGHVLQSYFLSHGIIHRLSCPGTPEQNGVAERKHRHIVETGLTLLAHSNLTSPFWAHVFATAVYLINRLPSPLLKFDSPYSLFFDKEPSHLDLRVFGALCYPCLRPLGRAKLDFKSCRCIFIGYSPSHKGYKCYDLSSGTILISRHVVFDETIFPSPNQTPGHPSQPRPFTFRPLPRHFPCPSPSPSAPDISPDVPLTASPDVSPDAPQNIAPQTSQHHTHVPSHSPTHSSPHDAIISCPTSLNPSQTTSALPIPPIPSPSIPQPPSTLTFPSPTSTTPSPSTPTAPSSDLPHPPSSRSHPMITRSMVGTRKPKALLSQRYPLSTCLLASSHSLPPEPTSFTQAHKDEKWRIAMHEEFDSLIKNKTWSLVPPDPSMNVVGCKWVY